MVSARWRKGIGNTILVALILALALAAVLGFIATSTQGSVLDFMSKSSDDTQAKIGDQSSSLKDKIEQGIKDGVESGGIQDMGRNSGGGDSGTSTTLGTRSSGSTVTDGGVFVSPSELDAIRSKVQAGDEPWNTAYDRLIQDADRALGVSPKSVTDNGGGNYWKSDNGFRHDYLIAIKMGDWIRDLGLAYQLTGEDKYARKAIDLTHHWFIDENSRMYPTTDNNANSWSIEIYITVPKMLYGASLVRDHPYWAEQVGDAKMNDWVSTFLQSAETHKGWAAHNNIYAWNVQTRAVAAAYLGDDSSLKKAFDDWKRIAIDQVSAKGTLKHELGRGSRNLHYSLYGMKALALTAEIARYHGVDLYGHSDNHGTVMKRVFDYHAKYVGNAGSWPHHSSPDISGNEMRSGAATYELAYSAYRDETYLNAMNRVGRPLHDMRILGWTTLTHGNQFELQEK